MKKELQDGTKDEQRTDAEFGTSAPLAANPMLSDVPVRIQRSRKNKQISPNGLPIVYVGRPSQWGNPYKAMGDTVFEMGVNKRWVFKKVCANNLEAVKVCVALYTEEILPFKHRDLLDAYFISEAMIDHIVTTLKGKNLSCWCKIGEPCHADILLDIANRFEHIR